MFTNMDAIQTMETMEGLEKIHSYCRMDLALRHVGSFAILVTDVEDWGTEDGSWKHR
jgi:hypothetical protein